MWGEIVRLGGLDHQGIFRLAPDPNAVLAAEKAIQKGQLPPHTCAEVLAHLIKSFLRRLPGSLFGRVPKELIDGCRDGPGYAALSERLSAHERALLEWLVRVICEVAKHKEKNLMGLRNLTLVIAPNLLVPAPDVTDKPKSKPMGLVPGFRSAKGPRRGSSSPTTPTANPVEELMNMEMVSNALHTLACSSMRV